MSRILTAVILALTVPVFSLAAAQSLGDVAKKEGERRQGVKPSGKTLTNKDLPNAPPPSSAPVVSSDASAGAPAAAPAGGAAAGDRTAADAAADAKGDTGARDEKYWASRMKGLRDDLSRDRLMADALQSRINGLTVDFVNRDDPAQRAQIARDRQTAVDELDRVKKSIVERTKAIGDLEEEARRAGAPAGWLR